MVWSFKFKIFDDHGVLNFHLRFTNYKVAVLAALFFVWLYWSPYRPFCPVIIIFVYSGTGLLFLQSILFDGLTQTIRISDSLTWQFLAISPYLWPGLHLNGFQLTKSKNITNNWGWMTYMYINSRLLVRGTSSFFSSKRRRFRTFICWTTNAFFQILNSEAIPEKNWKN